MTNRFIPLRYKIHDIIDGSRTVCGYAVRSDVPVRFCVREIEEDAWVCDHYDTGARFGNFYWTKEEAADMGEIQLIRAIDSGLLDKSIDAFYKKVAARPYPNPTTPQSSGLACPTSAKRSSPPCRT